MQNVDAPGEDVRLEALEVPVMSKHFIGKKMFSISNRFSFDIILHFFQGLSRLEALHAVYLK